MASMQIQFVAKGVDLSEALRERVEARIEESVDKYFNRPGEALVTVTKTGHSFRLNCSVHLPSGVVFQTKGDGDDAYQACDEAMVRMEKRLRRYKTRLKDHGPGMKGAPVAEDMPVTVFEGRGPKAELPEEEGAGHVVIAESAKELRRMPVSMAVFELELSDAPFLMFRNAAHDAVNLVYRRPDGNIGWMDPSRAEKSS